MLFACGCVTTDDLQPGPGADTARKSPRLTTPLRLDPLAEEDIFPEFVNLRWSAVPGATMYAVYLGIDTNPPLLATVSDTRILVRDLPYCTVHQWRVVALSEEEAVSSPTWSFKTRCR